uniref:ATP synthase subunit b n=1 Tax=Podarcis muralis TaxID=64176 RepID=A0A670J3W6_PODMU
KASRMALSILAAYIYGTGLLLYMVSKELYIVNHETIVGGVMAGILIYIIKKYSADVAAFADKLNEDTIAQATSGENVMIADHTTAIEEKKEQGPLYLYLYYLFAIMLEANYRVRLFTVYTEVKKRLDYHVAIQHLRWNMEQNHMIIWVEQNIKPCDGKC